MCNHDGQCWCPHGRRLRGQIGVRILWKMTWLGFWPTVRHRSPETSTSHRYCPTSAPRRRDAQCSTRHAGRYRHGARANSRPQRSVSQGCRQQHLFKRVFAFIRSLRLRTAGPPRKSDHRSPGCQPVGIHGDASIDPERKVAKSKITSLSQSRSEADPV